MHLCFEAADACERTRAPSRSATRIATWAMPVRLGVADGVEAGVWAAAGRPQLTASSTGKTL